MADQPNFDLRFHPRVDAEIRRWGLNTSLLVDVFLRLKDVLPSAPVDHLVYDRDAPERGAFFPFELREDDVFLHVFAFRVIFTEDEKTLFVVHASYSLVYAPVDE